MNFHFALKGVISPGVLALLLSACLVPSRGLGCACGCGIYEVGTSSMMPTGTGLEGFLDYAYQDQNQDWSGDSKAPAANNGDKDIRTSWYTLGLQEMFSPSWGLRLDLPYEERHFVTTGGATGDEIVSFNFSGIGDIRLEGIYSGFSADRTAGLTFGLKLPSGTYGVNDAYGDVDRDSQIGSGSTDILIGGYKRIGFDTDYGWSGFTQALLDVPVLTQAQYRPGSEFDAAAGAYYNGFRVGRALLLPIGLIKLSVRGRDTGANASYPVASGFVRVLAAPGLEVDMHPYKVYADIALPLYYHVTGDQLVAKAMFQLNISYMF
jgi:hypothetical protein